MGDQHVRSARPAISFAIPYYRGAGYLREAIESVIAQTVGDWELVVVDDCGPEPAESVVASYGDPRITNVRNRINLGLAGNWNECLRRTRAHLVTILHADDRLLPHYAEVVLRAAKAHPEAAAIFTDAVVIDALGRPTTTVADRVKARLPRPAGDHLLRGDADLAGLLFGNYIVCPSLCLRRSVVGPQPFRPDLRFVPDWELTTRLLMQGQALYGVRTPLIEYRRHGGTATTEMTTDSSRFIEELELLRRRAHECARLGWEKSARTARARVTVRGHLLVRAGSDLLLGRRRAAATKARILWSDVRGRDRLGSNHPDPQQRQEEPRHDGL